MRARIEIRLRAGVLDPEADAITHALAAQGFDGIDGLSRGKFIEMELTESDRAKAEAQLTEMCEKLLANTVIERYRVELLD